MAHVMVLDDEPGICYAFRGFLEDDGHRVSIASTAEQALDRVAGDPPDVLFLDVRLPGMDGLTALERFHTACPAAAIVVMTAHGTVQTAVRAVRGGAFDYLTKPFDLEQARSLVGRALDRSTVPPAADREPAGSLIGRSPAMQAVFKQIAVAASCAETVLITGESGTGKELVARAIHQHGDRADRPFVAVHLAALPEALIERELFGHERGAYTGADTARPGLFDRAAGGTLFLDEIAEANPNVQAKLLRVLDGHEYRPVGSQTERRLEARVVAATNRDLAASVRDGSFRADLYYRLAVLPIHLPPLRERAEDIPRLWSHFVGRVRDGEAPATDPDSTLGRQLRRRTWPGNIRELRNAAEHATRAAGGGPILPAHLPPPLDESAGESPGDRLNEAIARWATDRLQGHDADDSDLYDAFLRDVEAPFLRALRAWSGGNQARMARRLGLHRTTLRLKLRQHGIDASDDSRDG